LRVDLLALQARLQRSKRQHLALTHRDNLPVEQHALALAAQRDGDFGVRMRDVVQRAGKEGDTLAVHVRLRADAVVLVFAVPKMRIEIGIGVAVEQRRGKHETDRRAETKAQ